MATGPRWTRRPIVALIACILCALGATGRGAPPSGCGESALAGTWYPADPAELRPRWTASSPRPRYRRRRAGFAR